MHRPTRLQTVYFPTRLQTVHIYFQCYAFWWKSFHMPVQKRKKKKRRKKGLRVSNFALLLVVYKWHAGSERVKGLQSSEWLLTGSEVPFWRIPKGSLVICRCKGSHSTHWLFTGREVSLKGVMKYSLTVQLAVMCYFNGLQSTRWLLIGSVVSL